MICRFEIQRADGWIQYLERPHGFGRGQLGETQVTTQSTSKLTCSVLNQFLVLKNVNKIIKFNIIM